MVGLEHIMTQESKCRGYNKAQEAVCQCVPKAEAQDANEKKLKSFYKKFNPEKLDSKGGRTCVNSWSFLFPATFCGHMS